MLLIRHYAVFLPTVITESYRVKIVLSPMEKVRKVAMLSFVHAPEMEIFLSAKLHILSRNYFLKNTPSITSLKPYFCFVPKTLWKNVSVDQNLSSCIWTFVIILSNLTFIVLNHFTLFSLLYLCCLSLKLFQGNKLHTFWIRWFKHCYADKIMC